MLRRIIFVSMLSILAAATFAQEKIILKEEKLSDFQPQSLFRTNNQVGYLFKVGDGEYQTVGYKGEKVEDMLSTNEAAYKEFKRFKRKIAIGKIGYWTGGAALVSLPFLIQDDDTQATTKFLVVGAIELAGTLTWGITHRNAPKHLINAVEIYNQNLE
ncbi:MAG: hypothetical protein AB8G11_14290 [Saprospiraceae bacterium]